MRKYPWFFKWETPNRPPLFILLILLPFLIGNVISHGKNIFWAFGLLIATLAMLVLRLIFTIDGDL